MPRTCALNPHAQLVPPGGWDASWLKGVLALVVILSFLVSVLVLELMVAL